MSIKKALGRVSVIFCYYKQVTYLTFIRVMVTLLTALPKSVSCYENAFCFQKVLDF